MAREKKEFTADSKLGFMRFIQVYNVFIIFICMMLLLFVHGSAVKFDFQVVTFVLLLLCQAAVVWLIARRKIYTRQIVIGIEIVAYLINIVDSIVNGNFLPITPFIDAIPPLIVISYFAFSRRAKAVLVQPWSSNTLQSEQETKNRDLWDLKSRAFWMRLLIYFFVFSVMGHWMEMGVQILVANGLFPGTLAAPDSLTWRDSLNPFPIYGIAVVVCGLALYPLYLKLRDKMPKRWQALLISFLVNLAFCVLAELILGLAFNADYHAWDYRDQFMNFMGQVCLVYAVSFGIASSLITWVIYPLLERQFSHVNRDVFRLIFAISCVVYLLIIVTYNIDPPAFFDQLVASSTSGGNS